MLVGHQRQWQFLKKMTELGKIPHALLFSGEEKLGKKTIALEFFKLLNCEKISFEERPCQPRSRILTNVLLSKTLFPPLADVKISLRGQICKSCQLFQKKVHPDLIIIEPDGPASAKASAGKKSISISQIRELERKLSLSLHSANLKMAMIDQAHRMNKEAQSAFLKTLEEPKGKTLFILITEYPEILLPTITSRCENIKFFPVRISEIKDFFIQQGIPEKKAQLIAQSSFGRPGRAIEFLKNPEKLEFQEKILREIPKLIGADLNFRFSYAKELANKPNDVKEVLEIWLRYFREKLKSRAGVGDKSSLKKLTRILKLIENINFLISTTNINPRLALEILMLNL